MKIVLAGRDYTMYSINGKGSFAKQNLAAELVKRYIQNNPNLNAQTVVKNWRDLGNFVMHFIETQEEYDKRTDEEPRVKGFECNGEKVYVSTNGWGAKM